jgi:hypothetical protein
MRTIHNGTIWIKEEIAIFMSIKFRLTAVEQWHNCHLIVPKVEGLSPATDIGIKREKQAENVYQLQYSGAIFTILHFLHHL